MINKSTYTNYMQMPQHVPQFIWNICRVLTVGIGYGLIITSFTRPQTTLFLVWRMIVPLLPIIFFIAPCIWRNICPMAALNQAPPMLNVARDRTLPMWFKMYA